MKENLRNSRHQQLLQIFLIALVFSVCFVLGSNVSNRVLLFHGETNDNDTHQVELVEKVTVENPLDTFLRETLAPDYDPILRGKLQTILSASINLISIRSGPHASIEDHSRSYSGILATFCTLNFIAQKRSPHEFSSFERVVENSQCDSLHNVIHVDLKEVVQLARQFDAFIASNADRINNNVPTILNLRGVVFHESRCGATLAANSMAALNPAKNRVYSEAGPPEYAMKICAEGYTRCSVESAANLLKDVVYMMGRSNDAKEDNVFFTLQPEATRTIETFRTAFPTTPWIFLYRNPVEAILSNQDGRKAAFSLHESPMVRALIEQVKLNDRVVRKQMHAIQLATFCWSALRNFQDADGLGLAVEYSYDLAADFIDTIFPKHFHTLVDHDGKERIEQITRIFSKRDGLNPGPPGGKDTENSIDTTQSIRDAAEDIIESSYKKLQDSKYNLINCRKFNDGGGTYIRIPDNDETHSDD